MDGYSGPLYVINALPLASVAELADKLWVFCYDPTSPSLLEHDEEAIFEFDREQTVQWGWASVSLVKSFPFPLKIARTVHLFKEKGHIFF